MNQNINYLTKQQNKIPKYHPKKQKDKAKLPYKIEMTSNPLPKV